MKLIHGVNSHPSPATLGACLHFFLSFFKGSFVQLFCCASGCSLPVSLSKTRAAGSVPGPLGPLSGVSDYESIEHKALYTVRGVRMSGDSVLLFTDGPESVSTPSVPTNSM